MERGREKGNDFIPRAMKEDDDKFVYEKTRGGKLRILALKRTVTKKERKGGRFAPSFPSMIAGESWCRGLPAGITVIPANKVLIARLTIAGGRAAPLTRRGAPRCIE